MFSLNFGGSSGWGLPRRPDQRRRQPRRARAAGDGAPAASATNASLNSRLGGIGGLVNAGAVAGTTAGLASLTTQFLSNSRARAEGDRVHGYDAQRTIRIAGTAALALGPYLHALLSVLDWRLPAKTMGNLLAKVGVSQLALGPAVWAFTYVWALGNEGSRAEDTAWSERIKEDLSPSTMDGWKFWVPATALTLALVPFQSQVLAATLATVGFAAYESHKQVGDAAARAPTLVHLRAKEAARAAAAAREAAAEAETAQASKGKGKAKQAGGKHLLGLSDNQAKVLVVAAWIAACAALKRDKKD